MTVLRHPAPAGTQVTARLYSGNKYAPGSGTALTAVADAQGWASFTLPDPGSRKAYWTLTRPGASPVVVAVPRGSATLDSTAVQLGTLDTGSDLVDTRPPSTPLSPTALAAAHDTDPERETFVPARLSDAALRAAFGSADPVLSNFSYDAATGNLLSYQEDGVTITLTYNADGTVATSKRGSAPAKTYSYSGGNLTGVA